MKTMEVETSRGMNLNSRWKSPYFSDPLSKVMATKNTVFIDRCVSNHVAMSSRGSLVRHLRRKLRSHVDAGCLICGKRLCIPLRKLFIVG